MVEWYYSKSRVRIWDKKGRDSCLLSTNPVPHDGHCMGHQPRGKCAVRIHCSVLTGKLSLHSVPRVPPLFRNDIGGGNVRIGQCKKWVQSTPKTLKNKAMMYCQVLTDYQALSCPMRLSRHYWALSGTIPTYKPLTSHYEKLCYSFKHYNRGITGESL